MGKLNGKVVVITGGTSGMALGNGPSGLLKRAPTFHHRPEAGGAR